MKRYTVGIDPGISGGWALLDGNGQIVYTGEIPTVGKELDAIRFYESLIDDISPVCTSNTGVEPLVGLEKVGPFPKGSRLAAFSFGGIYQSIKTCIKLAGLPYTDVAPRLWQKEMYHGLDASLKGKHRSKAAVSRLWPGFKIGKHDGIWDGLLIAEYVRRKIA